MARYETEILIFDFDGTIYDTVGGIHKAVNIVATEHKIPEFEKDLVRSMIGYGLTDLIERLDQYTKNRLGDLEAVREKFRQVYNQIALSESSLFPGAIEFLKSWPGDLAIVSNKEEFSLKKMVEGSPLASLKWTAVYGGDTWPARKPSPLPIEKVLEGAGYGTHQAIFVGDGIPDFMAAQAASVPFIGCSFGYSHESELRQMGAHRFIQHFSELPLQIQQVDAERNSQN